MSITQKFYPKFLQWAFCIADGVTPAFNSSGEMACYVDLYSSGLSFDPERFFAISSNGINIFDYDIPGTTKEITVTATRTGAKLFFNIPEVYWETAPGSPFRHAIFRTTGGGGGATFLHVDFGSELNPSAGFRLIQNPSCIPHIDFTPIACAAGIEDDLPPFTGGGDGLPPTFDSIF